VNQPSPTSAKSERLRAIRRLSNRSFRDQVQRFLIEGPQVVGEAVRLRPNAISEVLVSDTATLVAEGVAEAARGAGCTVTLVPEEVLISITETVTPQGIAAICLYLDLPLPDLISAEVKPIPKLVVLLDQVRDPGNAGTVLRTSAAAGADMVLFSKSSVDPYNGKCVRSSAGAVFQTRIGRDVASPSVLAAAQSAGLNVVATDLNAGLRLGAPEVTQRLIGPTLWVFGNEAHGLDPEIMDLADMRLKIPIYGETESLNLAAAAAIGLYASAFAQHEIPA
jgi:TrmH family RNA methyltransferase